MIANYGYHDGSGEYFITIDTGRCVDCAGRWCVAACPESLFVIEVDDYDDDVAVIAETGRKKLKEACAGCKPAAGYASLPCIAACLPGAVSHSW
jgi:predicted molibdopterin-dependent oxidoreductase YjgC